MKTQIFLLLLLILPATSIFADNPPENDTTPLNLTVEQTTSPANQPPDLGHSAFKMVTGTGMVLMLIGVCAWIARQYFPVQKIGAKGEKREPIEILTRKSIGNKQSLILIQVGEAVLLLGRSPQTITTLCRLDQAEEMEIQQVDLGLPHEEKTHPVRFEEQLFQAMDHS